MKRTKIKHVVKGIEKLQRRVFGRDGEAIEFIGILIGEAVITPKVCHCIET
jgi:hypothetical protein